MSVGDTLFWLSQNPCAEVSVEKLVGGGCRAVVAICGGEAEEFNFPPCTEENAAAYREERLALERRLKMACRSYKRA